MANIPERWDGQAQWYFVTIVTKDRLPVFADHAACRILQNAFHKTHRYYPFRLAALVIMPDHWHGLIRPAENVVIEQVVGAVKRNVLRDLNKTKSVWQPRFLDHRIRNNEDFMNHCEYIRLNPKKHGYAREDKKYQWLLFIHPRPFG
ncbi:transposase [Desulfonema ishimotonii]|uniref:Transposase n=1 Tax=Desulfonema ishimotonii TaxID=45657 RepID=A0A401FUH2_9BACT|nr:transposase [Desulfonema ishimotonii]GBC60611.1 transposase [Desulfonema ishimotonii]